MSKYYENNFEHNLPSEIFKKFIGCVDSEYGYSVALKLTEFKSTDRGFRIAGTDAEARAGKWIAEEMKRIGLKNVTIEEFPVDCWDFREAYVTVLSEENEPAPMFAGSFPGVPEIGDEIITGEVVYVAEGTAAYYENLDVRDKIVLIDTDCYHTYWFDSLFTQAEIRGAKAIIATVTDQGPGTYRDDLITIQNMQTKIDTPAVMMTKHDGEILRNALKEGKKLKVSISMDLNTRKSVAHYVYGMIMGKNPDKYIIASGHYDAYWEGFQDNASSVGSVLTIAKAMIDSGYEPDKTFIFMVNGAEEFGTKNTRYDFCTGANAIIHRHLEWVKNTVLFNNYELSAITDTEHLELNIAPCFVKIIKSLLRIFGYNGDFSYIMPKGVGADDGVFAKQGVPTYMTVCTHFSDVEAMGESLGEYAIENYDHTQFDNKDTYNAEVFDFNNKLNGMINIAVDMMPYIPADYAQEMDMYIDSINTSEMRAFYRKAEELKKIAEEIKEKSTILYNHAIILNQSNVCKHANEYVELMLEINRIVQKEMCRFDPFHQFIYSHVQPYKYIVCIDNLIEGLKNGDAQKQLEMIMCVDNTYLIAEFDKEVYDKIAIKEFSGEAPVSWGSGEHMPFPYMYDVIRSVMNKVISQNYDCEKEIEELQRIRNEQHRIFIEALDREYMNLNKINSILDNSKELVVG